MDIVEELRQDREKGARRLESEYKAGLMSLALRFCHDHGDAEELVNRTFAAVIDGIDGYLEQSAFFGWMCQILTNIHSNDNRRKARQGEVCTGEIPDIPDETAEGEAYRALDASFLRDAIETLPEDIRKTLLLHYFMDMPVKEVARVLSSPTSTITWRLHYARKILAAKLGAAAKKPGGKALLLALALCGLTALGAAVALVGDAAFSRVRRDAAGQRGGDLQIAVESPDGGREAPSPLQGAGQGGGDLQIAAESPDGGPDSASPAPTFDFGLSTFDQPPQQETTMNATTLRTLAASAALAAATGAPRTTSASPAAPPASVSSNTFVLDTRPSPQTAATPIESFSTQPSAFVLYIK